MRMRHESALLVSVRRGHPDLARDDLLRVGGERGAAGSTQAALTVCVGGNAPFGEQTRRMRRCLSGLRERTVNPPSTRQRWFESISTYHRPLERYSAPRESARAIDHTSRCFPSRLRG